jgi:hypothetical protein
MSKAVCICVGPREVCKIAALADVDHRTVLRFLAGEVAQRNSRARGRIIDAMRKLDLDEHVPSTRKHPRAA